MDDAATEARKAYESLLRSRSKLQAQRDDLNQQLERIESVLGPLQALLENVAVPVDNPIPAPESTSDLEPIVVPEPEPETPKPVVAATTSSAASSSSKRPRAAAKTTKPAQPVGRKARLRVIMLESPNDWLTVSDIATRIEGREPSESQRTATYEMLRRMAKQGELEHDSSSKPTKFRARTGVLRERLLAEGS